MEKIGRASTERKPHPALDDLSPEERDVIDGASKFLRGVMAYASKLARAAETARVVEPDPPGLTSKKRTGKLIGVSTSTLDRFVHEGAPWHPVGNRKAFDLAELRTWLDARGRRPTKAKSSERVDVTDVLSRNGLRSIGGSR